MHRPFLPANAFMKRKHSVILGNLGNTRDRFCSGYKENPGTMVILQRAHTHHQWRSSHPSLAIQAQGLGCL